MRTLLILIIGYVLVSTAFSSDSTAPGVFSDNVYKTETFRVDGPASLKALTSGGSITVESHERNEIIIEVLVRRGSSYLTTEEDVNRYVTIGFSQSGNSVSVEAENKGRSFFGGTGASVSYVITVPVETSTELRTSGGNVTLSGVEGSQSLRTSGGGIRLSEIDGSIEARTSGGSLRMSHINGDLDARTSGGSISLTRSSGNLAVRTSGGSITLEEVSGRINGSTSGGSINADIDSIEGELSLSTSGGNVTAVVPSSMIEDNSGGITLNMRGSRTRVENDGDSTFNGTKTDRRVNGSYGNGAVNISLTTSAGTSTLRFK